MPSRSAKKATSSPSSLTDFTAVADKYAASVVSGKIPACKWVVLACKRHIAEKLASKSPKSPWQYRAESANKACRFIELLPHTKDDFEKRAAKGLKIKLEPWQVFNICSLFGWFVRGSDVYRFNEAYICVPRKNGKSVLAAGIGLYKFAADNEFGAEVYSGATSEKQAWEVFRPARQMVERTPMLKEKLGITINAKSLTILKNGSRFEPIIGKPGDGASPSCAIVDEYHEHPDDTLYDTMRTGMAARLRPLQIVITTAGSDRSGPCYALQIEVQEMLAGHREDPRRYGIIYTIDEGDDWTAESSLRKANPNFGVSVTEDFLLEAQRQAKQSAHKQNSFKNKHENIWTNTAVGWMNMAAWDQCADKNLSLDDFAGEPCWIGLDLASKVDIAAKLRVFRRELEGKTHYYAFGEYYLNEAKVEGQSHYAGWQNEKRLTVTPGSVTDFNWIADGLLEDVKRFDVREIPHDPHNASALLQFLQARPDWVQSVVPVEILQSRLNMSPPMKELEALVVDGRFHHDGDPILGWMIANIVVRPDPNELIFPRKEREENKIDGGVALIMAIDRATKAIDDNGDYFMVFDPMSARKGNSVE